MPGASAPVIRASRACRPISAGRLPSSATRAEPVRIAAHRNGAAVSTRPISETIRRGPSRAASLASTVSRSPTSGASPSAARSRPRASSRSQGSPAAVAVPDATRAPAASRASAICGVANSVAPAQISASAGRPASQPARRKP
ncbi:hypothetical protein [Methylobacterium sp. WL1]|uniref:hypothetical protein n=1 Tax=Methylobacterium sp. WL1 TaxID=2603276 RepID=UPI001FEE980D|nr:hypothetical protein [Methylobacterium sp. WL1]